MEKLSSIEFDVSANPKDVIATVMERGAAVIHDYLAQETIDRIAAELRAEPMALDEDMDSKVKRRQEMVKYALRADPESLKYVGVARTAPLGVATEAIGIGRYIRVDGGFEWYENEAMGHRYRKKYFIGKHQDLTSARGAIVSATVEGFQNLFIELDGDRRETRVPMVPGKVVIMRGYNDDDPARRPFHRVEEPEQPRLGLTIRQVGALASRLPHWDTKKDTHW